MHHLEIHVMIYIRSYENNQFHFQVQTLTKKLVTFYHYIVVL